MASPELEPQPQETVLKPKLFGKEFIIPLRENEFLIFREKLLKMDSGRALEIALFLGLTGLALTIYLKAHSRRSDDSVPEEIIPLPPQVQENFLNFWARTYRNGLGSVINHVGIVHITDAYDIVSNLYFKLFSEHWGRGKNYDVKPDYEQEDIFIKSLINRTANWRRDNFRRKDNVSLDKLTDKSDWDAPTGELIEDEIIEKLSQEKETEELHQAITDFLERSDRRRRLVAFLNMLKIPHSDIADIIGTTTGAAKAIWFRDCLGLRKAVANIIKPVGGKSVF